MILKTFDNDIDRWTAKIGIFSKSFANIANAWNAKKLKTKSLKDEGMLTKEAKSQVGSFWSYLTKPKENDKKYITNSQNEIVTSENIDSYLKQLTPKEANAKRKEILQWQGIANNKKDKRNWTDYYEILGERGDNYIIDLIKSTDNLSQLTGKDLVDANEKARQSIIEQNKALKDQTLGAKASKFALNALATVGNMAFDALVSYGITKAIEAWDNYANAQENAIERGNEALSGLENNQKKIANAQSVFDSIKSNTVTLDSGKEITRFEQLSKGVNSLGENISLTKDEFEEYNSILNQLSGAGLTATTSMSSLEKQIQKLRTDANNETLSGLGDWVDSFNAKNNQMSNDFTKEVGYQQKIDAINKAYNLQAQEGYEAIETTEKTWLQVLGEASSLTASYLNGEDPYNVAKKQQETAAYIKEENQKKYLEDIAKEFNIDVFDEDGNFSDEKFQTEKVQKQFEDAQETLVSRVESMVRQSAGYLQAQFENNSNFDKLSETTAKTMSGVFGNIDYATVSEFMLDTNGNLSDSKVKEWVDSIAGKLSNADIEDKLNELFTLGSKRDKMAYSEYKKQSEELIGYISEEMPELSESLLRKSSGLDDVVEDLDASYNKVAKAFGRNNANKLNTSDLKIAAEIIADDKFSGTFDDLLEKIYTANQAFGDLNSNIHFDAIHAADETENAGDDYLKAINYLDEAKEMYDKGLVGTDDFKARAAYFSASGSDDPANFADNYERAKRYLTEDKSGLTNFLNDLQAKGYATSETLADGTTSWSYNIEDLEDCAKSMGMSFEWLMDMFGRLDDYGFHNNFVASVEDGSARIADLSKELVKAEAKLAELEADPQSGQMAIDQQHEKIRQLRSDIEQTQNAMGQVAAKTAEDYKKQIDTAKTSINTLKEERERILRENAYDEDTERIASLMEDQIREWASENNIELDAELNIVNDEKISDKFSNGTPDSMNGVAINTESTNIHDIDKQIAELSDSLSDVKNENGIIDISVPGAKEAVETLKRLLEQKRLLVQESALQQRKTKSLCIRTAKPASRASRNFSRNRAKRQLAGNNRRGAVHRDAGKPHYDRE